MTKLKSNIKPELNRHTMKDNHKARKRLDRLVEILDSPSMRDQTDLDIMAAIKKRPLREVDV